MSAAASALAAAMGMIVNLVSVPLLLDSLGRDRFGVWMTIYSFVSMLSFLDFGIGLGLLTILARCSGLDDKRSAREHVSSAILILTVLASILALVLLFVHPFVPWAKLLGVDSLSLAPEAASSVLALGLCILIALPTSIGGRVQAAYQRGYVASLWDAAARVAVVVCLVLVARRNSDIPVVVTIVVGLPALFGADALAASIVEPCSTEFFEKYHPGRSFVLFAPDCDCRRLRERQSSDFSYAGVRRGQRLYRSAHFVSDRSKCCHAGPNATLARVW
jgi:O-antigen/teichoic acid export membrane protein